MELRGGAAGLRDRVGVNEMHLGRQIQMVSVGDLNHKCWGGGNIYIYSNAVLCHFTN